MPRMSLYFVEEDYQLINSMLRKILSLLLTIGIPAIVGVCALSQEIVVIIGGDSYLDAALPLKILMISFAFSLIGGNFLEIWFYFHQKWKYIYVICCIAALFNVVLNYLLIPHGGAKAAALTTTLSSLLIMVLLFIKKIKE